MRGDSLIVQKKDTYLLDTWLAQRGSSVSCGCSNEFSPLCSVSCHGFNVLETIVRARSWAIKFKCILKSVSRVSYRSNRFWLVIQDSSGWSGLLDYARPLLDFTSRDPYSEYCMPGALPLARLRNWKSMLKTEICKFHRPPGKIILHFFGTNYFYLRPPKLQC